MLDKQHVARLNAAYQALSSLDPSLTLGFGTGRAVEALLHVIQQEHIQLGRVISSSSKTSQILCDMGTSPLSINDVSHIDHYYDGADSFNALKQLLKGGGGCHTLEKICAANAKIFTCLVEESKKSHVFHKGVVVLEVLDEARSYVSREIVKLGGTPSLRPGFKTDYQNCIIDVGDLDLSEPIMLESKLNNIPGVVENGLFAMKTPQTIIIGLHSNGAEIIV